MLKLKLLKGNWTANTAEQVNAQGRKARETLSRYTRNVLPPCAVLYAAPEPGLFLSLTRALQAPAGHKGKAEEDLK